MNSMDSSQSIASQSQHPTISDDLPNRLIAGNVIVKPDIRRLNGRSVEFDDGSVADNIDAIICAPDICLAFPSSTTRRSRSGIMRSTCTSTHSHQTSHPLQLP